MKNNFYFISFFIILILYFLLIDFLFPFMSLGSFEFHLIDIIYIYWFSVIAYNICDYIPTKKRLIISYSFVIVAIFSFFSIEPLGISVVTKPLFFTDMPDLYPSLIEVVPLYLQIITIAATVLYFSLLIAFALYFVYRLYKMYNIKRVKSISLIVIVILTTYLSFFRPVKINSIYANYFDIANSKGIINTISHRISFDKKYNNIECNLNDVKNAINLLSQRDIDVSKLIMPYSDNTVTNRSVFLIYLESFYDYSHFASLFDKDPFPEEYRKWAKASSKVGPNDGNGSLFARLSGLTASSPIFPKKPDSTIITKTLPFLFRDKGYNVIALEESGVTYYLDKLFPDIGVEKTVFSLGITNIKNYIKDNISDDSVFVTGFTFLGHANTHIKNDLNFVSNNQRFMRKIDKKNRAVLVETLENSAMTAIDIIETRDIILEKYPDAIIIFKHDHLYPYLKNIIYNSSIDESIKLSFLSSYTVNPLLIWNGKDGAYKLEDGFPPENIPMFIAANTKLDYTNSLIELLYKENTDNVIRFYNSFYTNSYGNIRRIEVDRESLSYKYDHAQRVVSEDIFRGSKYFNSLID